MRLSILNNGHRRLEKLAMHGIRAVGLPVLDVVKTFMYRPEFFGRPFCDLGQDVLRGPSEWSVGERELFGAYTSQLNQCRF